jgi:hypothetical protein
MIPPIGKRGKPEMTSVRNRPLWLRKGNLATKGYQNFMPTLPQLPLPEPFLHLIPLQLDFSC